MADLQTLAAFAEILGGAAVVGGVAFAVVQLVTIRRDRRERAAIELVRPFQTTELWHAIQLVWALPDDAPPERIDGQPEVARAASTVSIAYETMGYMVYARLVPLSSFDELAGGAVRVCWRRLRPWTEHVRQTSGSPNAGEWFQWLAERLAESPAKGKLAGAHIAHRKWRP